MKSIKRKSLVAPVFSFGFMIISEGKSKKYSCTHFIIVYRIMKRFYRCCLILTCAFFLISWLHWLKVKHQIINRWILSQFHRYVVIVHPMKSRSWFTAGKMVKILSIVWFVAIALSYPTVHIMVRNGFSRTHVICCEQNRLIEIHASLAQKKNKEKKTTRR